MKTILGLVAILLSVNCSDAPAPSPIQIIDQYNSYQKCKYQNCLKSGQTSCTDNQISTYTSGQLNALTNDCNYNDKTNLLSVTQCRALEYCSGGPVCSVVQVSGNCQTAWKGFTSAGGLSVDSSELF
ncbi:MAG: hypothetical protein V4534_04180 [Myxococcota bacterium]